MGAKYKDADASHVVRGAQILGKCNDDAFKHVQNPVLQKLARDIHASIQNRAVASSSDTHRVAKFIFGVLQDVVALKLSCKPATHDALDREFIAEEKDYLRTFTPILEAYANNKHNDESRFPYLAHFASLTVQKAPAAVHDAEMNSQEEHDPVEPVEPATSSDAIKEGDVVTMVARRVWAAG